MPSLGFDLFQQPFLLHQKGVPVCRWDVLPTESNEEDVMSTAGDTAAVMVKSGNLIPKHGQLMVVIGAKSLDVVPAACLRPEPPALVEYALDDLLWHGLAPQGIGVGVCRIKQAQRSLGGGLASWIDASMRSGVFIQGKHEPQVAAVAWPIRVLVSEISPCKPDQAENRNDDKDNQSLDQLHQATPGAIPDFNLAKTLRNPPPPHHGRDLAGSSSVCRIEGRPIRLHLFGRSGTPTFVTDMNARQQIVRQLPVKELWTDAGRMNAQRVRSLCPDDVRMDKLVQRFGYCPLVVAEPCQPLHWVDCCEQSMFWQLEVSSHLETEEAASEGTFPNSYCYVASEWSTPNDGSSFKKKGTVILLERYDRAASSDCGEMPVNPATSRSAFDAGEALRESDREFYLGLYRYAVRRYQPIIEERTGVTLGEVQVKSIEEFHGDVLKRIESQMRTRLFRFLGMRGFTPSALASGVSRLIGDNHPWHPASYYNQAIYVGFTSGMRIHENIVIKATVHELAHRLWEKLGGRFPPGGWHRSKALFHFKRATEGYASYAERIWFADSYPLDLRKRIAKHRGSGTSVYDQGMRAVAKAVETHGEQILLKLPTKWSRYLDFRDLP